MPWPLSNTVVQGPGFDSPYGYPYKRPYKGRRSTTGSARTYKAGTPRANIHRVKSMRRRRGF